jgi:hypothetical protein
MNLSSTSVPWFLSDKAFRTSASLSRINLASNI